ERQSQAHLVRWSRMQQAPPIRLPSLRNRGSLRKWRFENFAQVRKITPTASVELSSARFPDRDYGGQKCSFWSAITMRPVQSSRRHPAWRVRVDKSWAAARLAL